MGLPAEFGLKLGPKGWRGLGETEGMHGSAGAMGGTPLKGRSCVDEKWKVDFDIYIIRADTKGLGIPE